MPFFPNSALCSKNYPRNINYMPAVIFEQALILEKIAILGQPPSRMSGRQILFLQETLSCPLTERLLRIPDFLPLLSS